MLCESWRSIWHEFFSGISGISIFGVSGMKAGWQTKTLGDACQIARGGSPRPIQDFMTDNLDGVNWIKISDATASGKFIYMTKEKIKPSGVARSRLVKPGDFLL